MSSFNNNMERIPKDPTRAMVPTPALPVPYAWARTPEMDSGIGLGQRRALRTIRKHWKAALAFALVVELLLTLFVFTLDNSYEARAVIDVEAPGTDAVGIGRDAVSNSANEPAYLDTQTEILNSDGLILKVVDQLHLDQNPVFTKRSWFEKSVVWLESWLPSNHKSEQQKDVDRLLLIFRRGLTVGQVKGSQLVEVRYAGADPNLSAQIVNAITEQYLQRTYRSAYDATLRAAASLSPQMDDLQKAVKKSTDALLQFQKTHEGAELVGAAIVSADGTTAPASAAPGNPIATRVGELNQQLTQAMGDRLQQGSYMNQIQSGKVDLLPQMKDNVLIQGLTSRLVDSRAQLAQALAVYGGNNPQVRKLELETEELSKQLDAERTRIAGQVQSAYSSAQNRENLVRKTIRDMKGQLDQSNSDVVQYDALKREADANANLYTTLSSQTKQMAMAGSLSSSNIRVLDNALVPLKPAGPHRFRILGVGAFAATISRASRVARHPAPTKKRSACSPSP
jgi:polysaccharide biosynthesis transport protein